MNYKILVVTPFSCSIEIENESNVISPYYSKEKYDVYANGELKLGQNNTNVFSIYDLNPNSRYEIEIRFKDESLKLEITTKQIENKKIIKNDGEKDYTKLIQDAINNVGFNGAVIIEEGVYNVKPLFLEHGVTLYLKKGAHLLASTNRWDYPILDELQNDLPLGTWEGRLSKMFASVITGIKIKHAAVIGEGTIDGNAQNSDWWIDHKNIRGGARPRDIYLNYCDDILIQGVTVCNTACWTIHPYYSDNVKLINLKVRNPKVSPNTDGCDPESVYNLEILGCDFSVGDDCIAVKSGKIEMVEKYYRPSEKITIRNCLMQDGHGAIVLGSEISSGVKDLSVENCLFVNTDRGLRIKTRRGRGEKCIIDNVLFKDIIMDQVLNPFVINMYYFCDSDGKSEYVQNKKPLPVDDKTPYLGNFKFQNIVCDNTTCSAGFFYGLPEQKINLIEFEDITVNMVESDIKFYPAMMCDIEEANQLGCYFHNVKEVKLNNLKINNQKGEKFILNNVDKINL